MIPPGGYESGKLYIKFVTVDKGVTIYLNSDDTAFTEVKITSQTNNFNKYSINNNKSFRVTAVPKINSYDTKYTFDYCEDGFKNPNAAIWAKLDTHAVMLKSSSENKDLFTLISETKEIGIGAGSAVLLIIICCFVRICCKAKSE